MTASPYKGLASFDDSEHDVGFFFGRDRERDVICANLVASRLTVLYGETGVGKSSVLRAGVAHTLREGDGATVIVFDSWKDDPAAGLTEKLSEAAGVAPGRTLVDTLEACSAQLEGDVYVVLDGFEEYFLYHEGEDGPASFFEQFPDAVRRPGLRASFLVALREDALARLDRFKASIPTLFGNYLRLDHLDRRAARDAIVRPVERANEIARPDTPFAVELELVEAVLDQVATGNVAFADAGRGAVGDGGDGTGRVETPYLQLVMQRLWDAEQESGSPVLRRQTLDDLGGADQIVRTHLERALDSLSAEERDTASAIFNHLVTPSGTKIAHAGPDLARYAGVDEQALQPVLDTLAHERILRSVAPNGGAPRYEIYHDVLGDAVLVWRADHEGARELRRSHQRQRRLLGVIGVGAVLLAAMVGVSIFAFNQRSEARAQAQQAHARQLTASAVSLLESDPSLSLSLAVESARLERAGDVEAVLRDAYLKDRRRAVFVAGGPVSTASFNLDGTRVVVASEDGKARIYDAVTHKLLRTLGHGAPVLDAVFSEDGRFVLTGAEDGAARLWDAESGDELRLFPHDAPVSSVAIDPTGERVATAGGRTVSIWQSDGAREAEIQWPKPVTGVSFNPAGTRLVVVGNDTVARLYDSADGRLVDTFPQGGTVTSAAFSGPGARLLVTTGENETARIWTLRDGKLLHELKGHRGSVLDAAFSPQASRLATASADGTARIWDVRTGTLVASTVGQKGIVRAVAFSPDGNFVVTGSDDRTAIVFKADDGDARAWFDGHAEGVRSVAFSPDGSTVLTASSDRTARLWDPRTQPQLDVVARYPGFVAGAAYAGSSAIAIAGPRNRVRLVRASDGRPLHTFAVPGPARAVATSADGQIVAVASAAGVAVFGLSGKRTKLALPGAAAVAVSADGSLVAGGGDGVARIWSADGTLRHELRSQGAFMTDAAFSHDGLRLATSSLDGTTRIWDVASGEVIKALVGNKGVLSVAFSPDGRLVLTSGFDHLARLWDAETGEVRQVLQWHFGRVSDANFSPDGRWIVTAGPMTIGLWTPGARDPLLPFGFGGHRGLLTSASFDPTGAFVLSSSMDGTVRLATCPVCTDLDTMLARAEAQLAASGRELTAEERERYGLD